LKNTLISLFKNLGANLISLPIHLFSVLMIARMLGPELTGITSATVFLVLSYSIFSHLGLLNALGQHYPFLVGRSNKKDKTEIENMPAIILSGMIIGGTIGSLIIASIAFYNLFYGENILGIGFLSSSVISILQIIKTFYLFLLRSQKKFDILAKFNLVSAIAPIIWLISANLGGLIFQWVSIIITELLTCIIFYFYFRSKVNLGFNLNFNLMFKYIKLGFPIFCVGFLFDFLMVSDRLFASLKFGTTELGIYSIASLGVSLLIIIPKTIGQIIYPLLAEKIGSSDFKINQLQLLFKQPSNLIIFFLPLLIGLVSVNIPLLIESVLPTYSQSIPSAQILVFIIYFMTVGTLYSTFLVTSLKIKSYAIILLFGVFLNFLFFFIFNNLNYGLVSIALSKLICFMFIYLLIIAYVEYLMKNSFFKIACFILKITFPIGLMYSIIFLVIPLSNFHYELSDFSHLYKFLSHNFIVIGLYIPIILFNVSFKNSFKYYLNIIKN